MNQRSLKFRRQEGKVKIVDASYATDDPTYGSTIGVPQTSTTRINFNNNISQQSLSSQSSSNGGDEVEASLTDEDTSPDVSNNVPNVVYTPKTTDSITPSDGMFQNID